MVLLKDLFDEAKANNALVNRERRLECERIKREYVRRNRSGLLNVYYQKCPACSKGYHWLYKLGDVKLTSVDLLVLRDKVLSNGYDWVVVDVNDARRTCLLEDLTLYDLKHGKVMK